MQAFEYAMRVHKCSVWSNKINTIVKDMILHCAFFNNNGIIKVEAKISNNCVIRKKGDEELNVTLNISQLKL